MGTVSSFTLLGFFLHAAHACTPLEFERDAACELYRGVSMAEPLSNTTLASIQSLAGWHLEEAEGSAACRAGKASLFCQASIFPAYFTEQDLYSLFDKSHWSALFLTEVDQNVFCANESNPLVCASECLQVAACAFSGEPRGLANRFVKACLVSNLTSVLDGDGCRGARLNYLQRIRIDIPNYDDSPIFDDTRLLSLYDAIGAGVLGWDTVNVRPPRKTGIARKTSFELYFLSAKDNAYDQRVWHIGDDMFRNEATKESVRAAVITHMKEILGTEQDFANTRMDIFVEERNSDNVWTDVETLSSQQDLLAVWIVIGVLIPCCCFCACKRQQKLLQRRRAK